MSPHPSAQAPGHPISAQGGLEPPGSTHTWARSWPGKVASGAGMLQVQEQGKEWGQDGHSSTGLGSELEDAGVSFIRAGEDTKEAPDKPKQPRGEQSPGSSPEPSLGFTCG